MDDEARTPCFRDYEILICVVVGCVVGGGGESLDGVEAAFW